MRIVNVPFRYLIFADLSEGLREYDGAVEVLMFWHIVLMTVLHQATWIVSLKTTVIPAKAEIR